MSELDKLTTTDWSDWLDLGMDLGRVKVGPGSHLQHHFLNNNYRVYFVTV